jgi:4-amino-4-deoxy-L-arabinose transferase-like glycosyltransferase
METIRLERLLRDRRTLWIVGVIALVLWLFTNLPWQLDDYDQAKQAFTSFEMIREGHWFFQRTPLERIATKPPLVGWISAGLFAVLRSWNLAWRLPSFLAAVALAIFLFRASKTAYGRVAGLTALAAFAFNLLTPRLATLVRTDMPLTLAIFLIGLLIWTKIRRHAAWDSRDRLTLFLLLTAAMLIKGPIVYAFVLPGLALFQWRYRNLETGSAWSGWWPWIASLVLFLVWVAGGVYSVPGFYHQVVVREFMGRFGGEIHRPQPWFFYLPHLLHKFAPWSVLMILLVVLRVRSQRIGYRALFRKMSPEVFWLICWAGGGVLVMSLLPSKRVDRIFPVIPPLCLLLAAQLYPGNGVPTASPSAAGEAARQSCRWAAVALLLSILITGGYGLFKVVTGYRDHRGALVSFGRAVRQEAAVHHWRYEVMSRTDEGLLLYLRKLHFVRAEPAIEEWNRGDIDALVVPEYEAPELMAQLKDATLSPLRSTARANWSEDNYVLLTRESQVAKDGS